MTAGVQNVSCSATWGGGRPLSELSRLIGRRMAVLRETARDSTVATAIAVLQSLRKETRAHRGRDVRVARGVRGAVAFELDQGLVPGFARQKGGALRRCFRRGSRRGARVELPANTVQLVPPSREWCLASVYRVRLSAEQRRRWPLQPAAFYVVAASDAACESYLSKRYGRIAARHSGLARAALAQAAGRISTRPPSAGRAGPGVAKAVRGRVAVRAFGSGERYSVEVADALVYAADALSSGRPGVARAMELAANRVAGRLRHCAGHLLDADLQTPFPEVAKRKGGA